MPIEVVSAEFLTTAVQRADWPLGLLPEVAFVGRSNVGKSSMLNALTRKKGLARVSSTPGRTRALQFFEVVYRQSPAARPRRVRFCDLPGYGYAEVSREERERWAAMIEHYLRTRDDLRAVVLILDGRHRPSSSDVEAFAFLRDIGRQIVIAVTKIDKLPSSKRAAGVSGAGQALGLERGDAVGFSAIMGTGTDALWTRICSIVEAKGPSADALPD